MSCRPDNRWASALLGRPNAAAISDRRWLPALIALSVAEYEVGSAIEGSSRSSSAPSRNMAEAGFSRRRCTQRSKSVGPAGPDPPLISR